MLHPQPHDRHQGEPVIELKDVSAGYDGHRILEGINLRIMPGDFIGLLGPSGAGKTTLLRTILGATAIYEGQVLVHGAPLNGKRPRVGYVPQLETIDWNFPVTVEEAVMMGLTMQNPAFPWHRGRDKKLAREMMDRLGIAHLFKRHIRELSGGQQQRVFLARALVSDPELLLLDEPTSGVDIKTRDEVMHLLHDLNHQGIAVVLTTHEINAVAVHLPWLVCVNRHLLAEGSPSEVITPQVLKETYGAEMPVLDYHGMPLVAESPHFHGTNGRRNGEATLADLAGPELEPELETERV
jgi:zinc/manganese transport system ATP-binding protein/zinc transport system ATP-binding protein